MLRSSLACISAVVHKRLSASALHAPHLLRFTFRALAENVDFQEAVRESLFHGSASFRRIQLFRGRQLLQHGMQGLIASRQFGPAARLHRMHAQRAALRYWQHRVRTWQQTAFAARAQQIQTAVFAARHLLEDYSDNGGLTTPDPDSFGFDSADGASDSESASFNSADGDAGFAYSCVGARSATSCVDVGRSFFVSALDFAGSWSLRDIFAVGGCAVCLQLGLQGLGFFWMGFMLLFYAFGSH